MFVVNHILFAILLYVLTIKLGLFPFSLLGLLIVILSSMIADVDIKFSTLGRKTKIFAFAFKHRGFFHSLFFGALLFMILYFAKTGFHFMFAIGYFSHLFLDSLSVSGIQLFWPLKKRVKGFLKIKNGGFTETIISIILFLIITYLLLNMIF